MNRFQAFLRPHRREFLDGTGLDVFWDLALVELARNDVAEFGWDDLFMVIVWPRDDDAKGVGVFDWFVLAAEVRLGLS